MIIKTNQGPNVALEGDVTSLRVSRPADGTITVTGTKSDGTPLTMSPLAAMPNDTVGLFVFSDTGEMVHSDHLEATGK